tara:strand:+ start:851 stop:2686 length:1836 start_codon:yes stop_codon:yes gene_type:complete
MAGINGSASWGIVPTANANSNLASMSFGYRGNYLISANDQLRYQIQWFNGNAVTEGSEASASNWVTAGGGKGDLVSVVFKVYSTTDSTLSNIGDWDLIGTISKARDISNRKYTDGSAPVGHRFTIDISQLVSDQLSYSLVPINKGTWQSYKWGGMNGGLTMQDNVIGSNAPAGSAISEYNVSQNGTFRRVRVTAEWKVINSDGEIIDATGTPTKTSTDISVINSVNQFETDNVYYLDQFNHGSEPTTTAARPQRLNTNCPNWYYNSTPGNLVEMKKPVRMDEQAEWLYWYVNSIKHKNATTKFFAMYFLYGKTYTGNFSPENEFVLSDFNSSLDLEVTGAYQTFAHSQNRMVVQNVSPDFINNNAYEPANQYLPLTTPIVPITANTTKYQIHVKGLWNNGTTGSPQWQTTANSASYWYEIDRESANLTYGFVRFHWLNRMGGIDSYTAKKDLTEGLTISRDVIERKSGDRTWGQDDQYRTGGTTYPEPPAYVPLDDDYISNTMRGQDTYKGGREVLNVNAERVQSVYTDPLNIPTSKWLQEIMTSPNVWIEMDTLATERNNTQNPYQRPSTKGYIPVIITNSDIETVNQSEGLVKFNIEYTLAHKVQTQRN